MNQSDRAQVLRSFVIGECVLYNEFSRSFDTLEGPFQEYCHRILNTVHRYCAGNLTLDGTFSDFECNVAMKARRLFT